MAFGQGRCLLNSGRRCGEFGCLSWGGDVGGGLVEEGWGEVDFSDDGLWFGDGVEVAGVGGS